MSLPLEKRVNLNAKHRHEWGGAGQTGKQIPSIHSCFLNVPFYVSGPEIMSSARQGFEVAVGRHPTWDPAFEPAPVRFGATDPSIDC